VAEDHIYLSGDTSFEAMELYPVVMAHEMGHFVQRQFSQSGSPGGSHAYADYEDPRLAWGEGSATGIAALVLGTPEERRVFTFGAQLVVSVVDVSRATVNGNAQTWPVGWYQESTIANLLWSMRDPAGNIGLTPEAVLAPLLSAEWNTQPWAGTVWAYVNRLKLANAAVATPIDNWATAHNIDSVGNDVWGSTETHAGNRVAQDVLPPYTQVVVGQALRICSVGGLNEFNKAGNNRLLRLPLSATARALATQGGTGSVPYLRIGNLGYLSPGQATLTVGAVTSTTAEVVAAVGECTVVRSPFSTDLPGCQGSASPPAEQCWTLTLQ
jgi:hypothetical protein